MTALQAHPAFTFMAGMTTEEIRKELTSRFMMMNPAERADAVVELYSMNIIDKARALELLGITRDEYLESMVLGVWYSELEARFESLPDEFMSAKQVEFEKGFE